MKSTKLLLIVFALFTFASCTSLVEEVPGPQLPSESGITASTSSPVFTPSGQYRPPQSARAACRYNGVISDMRGENNCEFIISLENGVRIIPVEISAGHFNLQHGKQVTLSYRPSSITPECNIGIAAEITCITEL